MSSHLMDRSPLSCLYGLILVWKDLHLGLVSRSLGYEGVAVLALGRDWACNYHALLSAELRNGKYLGIINSQGCKVNSQVPGHVEGG